MVTNNNKPWTDLAWSTKHYDVYHDGFPVVDGHLLFVPKNLTPRALKKAFGGAVKFGQTLITNEQIDGFNVGLNWGAAAGQTVEWPHIHFIPRHKGDVKDPVGGVRNTIPGQGNYLDKA
jgi:diadenosine tetraphosphate (Ap4A) HIT family hydrolase